MERREEDGCRRRTLRIERSIDRERGAARLDDLPGTDGERDALGHVDIAAQGVDDVRVGPVQVFGKVPAVHEHAVVGVARQARGR